VRTKITCLELGTTPVETTRDTVVDVITRSLAEWFKFVVFQPASTGYSFIRKSTLPGSGTPKSSHSDVNRGFHQRVKQPKYKAVVFNNLVLR